MTAGRVETMRALCDDLDDSIQMARENRAPIRVLALIELARADLQRSIDQIEEGSTVVELGLKAKGK
jgi:hypothetical protein